MTEGLRALSWHWQLLVLGWGRKLTSIIKIPHVYMAPPQKLALPGSRLLIRLCISIYSYSATSHTTRSTQGAMPHCAPMSQFEPLLSNFTLLEKRDPPRQASARSITCTGLQKVCPYAWEKEESNGRVGGCGNCRQGQGVKNGAWALISGLVLSAES